MQFRCRSRRGFLKAVIIDIFCSSKCVCSRKSFPPMHFTVRKLKLKTRAKSSFTIWHIFLQKSRQKPQQQQEEIIVSQFFFVMLKPRFLPMSLKTLEANYQFSLLLRAQRVNFLCGFCRSKFKLIKSKGVIVVQSHSFKVFKNASNVSKASEASQQSKQHL